MRIATALNPTRIVGAAGSSACKEGRPSDRASRGISRLRLDSAKPRLRPEARPLNTFGSDGARKGSAWKRIARHPSIQKANPPSGILGNPVEPGCPEADSPHAVGEMKTTAPGIQNCRRFDCRYTTGIARIDGRQARRRRIWFVEQVFAEERTASTIRSRTESSI